MGYNNLHKFDKVFKMGHDKMTEAEVRAKYDRTAPKPVPVNDSTGTPPVLPSGVKRASTISIIQGGAPNNYFKNKADRAKKLKQQYGDVMDKEGKPILNPIKLLTSNKFNYPRWEGRMMDAAVEGVKNVITPGRFVSKIKRAYKYKNITKNKF